MYTHLAFNPFVGQLSMADLLEHIRSGMPHLSLTLTAGWKLRSSGSFHSAVCYLKCGEHAGRACKKSYKLIVHFGNARPVGTTAQPVWHHVATAGQVDVRLMESGEHSGPVGPADVPVQQRNFPTALKALLSGLLLTNSPARAAAIFAEESLREGTACYTWRAYRERISAAALQNFVFKQGTKLSADTTTAQLQAHFTALPPLTRAGGSFEEAMREALAPGNVLHQHLDALLEGPLCRVGEVLCDARNFVVLVTKPRLWAHGLVPDAWNNIVLQFDVTYKVCWLNLNLFIVGRQCLCDSDTGENHFLPLAYTLIAGETVEAYQFLFEQLKHAVNATFEGQRAVFRTPPTLHFLADGAMAPRNALRDVFDVDRDLIAMCYFHVTKRVRDNKRKLRDSSVTAVQSLLRDIGLLHGARSLEEFRGIWAVFETLWTDDNAIGPSFVAYFRREWIELRPCWFVGALPDGYMPSNNGVEGTNSGIKSHFLHAKLMTLDQVMREVSTLLFHALAMVREKGFPLLDVPTTADELPRKLWKASQRLATQLSEYTDDTQRKRVDDGVQMERDVRVHQLVPQGWTGDHEAVVFNCVNRRAHGNYLAALGTDKTPSPVDFAWRDPVTNPQLDWVRRKLKDRDPGTLPLCGVFEDAAAVRHQQRLIICQPFSGDCAWGTCSCGTYVTSLICVHALACAIVTGRVTMPLAMRGIGSKDVYGRKSRKRRRVCHSPALEHMDEDE